MIACVFPGQGSQRAGMGRPWKGRPSWEVVDTVAEATGCNVARLLLDADDDELRATRNAQLSLYAMELVLWSELARIGVRPTIVAGHSLGELTALVAAEAMSVEDGAMLVAARARAMEDAGRRSPGTMAAVIGLGVERVDELCASLPELWVSAENALDQVTVAGSIEGVESLKAIARQAGAKRVLPLNVAAAFHTPFMADALPAYHERLWSTPMRATSIDVVANVDACVHRDPGQWRLLLLGQITSRVRWHETMELMRARGVDLVVEVGPGRALSALVQRALDVPAIALDGPEPDERLSEVRARCAASPPHILVLRASDVGTASVPEVRGTMTVEGELLTEGSVIAWIGASPQHVPCSGWLLEVLVTDGDAVTAGQPLARIYRL